MSGSGLYSTKNIDVGALVLVTKTVATERCILPKGNEDLGGNAQLFMWKDFMDKVNESASKCLKTWHLISKLSTRKNGDDLEIPDISLSSLPQKQPMSSQMKTLIWTRSWTY